MFRISYILVLVDWIPVCVIYHVPLIPWTFHERVGRSRILIRFTFAFVARTLHYWYYVFLIESYQKTHTWLSLVIRSIGGFRCCQLIYHYNFQDSPSSNCFSSHWWLLPRFIISLEFQKGYTLILSSHLYLLPRIYP